MVRVQCPDLQISFPSLGAAIISTRRKKNLQLISGPETRKRASLQGVYEYEQRSLSFPAAFPSTVPRRLSLRRRLLLVSSPAPTHPESNAARHPRYIQRPQVEAVLFTCVSDSSCC